MSHHFPVTRRNLHCVALDVRYPQARLVLGVVAEVGVGDHVLGQALALQQRPEVVRVAGGGQFGAQEQGDHLRLAAWPQPPHTVHLAPASVVVTVILPAVGITQAVLITRHPR